MAQIGCCAHHKGLLRNSFPICGKYDFGLWKSKLVSYEEPNIIELRASLGRQIVSELPAKFRTQNNGRFIAITFDHKIIAVCGTLEALNSEIAKKIIKENYYMERIGHRTITQI